MECSVFLPVSRLVSRGEPFDAYLVSNPASHPLVLRPAHRSSRSPRDRGDGDRVDVAGCRGADTEGSESGKKQNVDANSRLVADPQSVSARAASAGKSSCKADGE